MGDLDTDFADDDGRADPALRTAIDEFVASPTLMSAAVLLDVLTSARLLVPVVAVVDNLEVDQDGRPQEKDSHMRSVEFHAADGRRALLAFTGTDALAEWDPQARPIPRQAHIVAQSVLQADLDALIVDIAGPTPATIDGAMLVRLAVSAHRQRYLDAALEDACDALELLAGVEQADWDADDDQICVTLQVSRPPADLGTRVATVLQDPNLAIVLDRPLTVRIEDFGAGPDLG
jgi:hypothetical protein